MASPSSGASIGVRVPEPMVDLSPLVQHLAVAIQPWPTPHPKVLETSHSFITWDPWERALILDTNAVLRRLWRTGKALEAMRSFLGDVDVPRSVARAHLGGVIKPGTEAQLRDATRRLALSIDAEIERAVEEGFDPSILATTATTSVLGALGRQLGIDLERPLPGPTRVVRTHIAPVASSQEQRRDEVARIVDAVEEVESTRAAQFDRFFASVEPRLLDQGYPRRQVAAALQYHRASAERSGTQLDRFFDFLENEALSRVRMQVTSHIMEALGNAAEERLQAGVAGDWALLRAYCRRAVGLLGCLGAADGQSVRLNLSAEFGQRAAFTLRDQVAAAGFVTCLPVWPEWRTQMFEDESPPTGSAATGPSITRELTYHFRVNGIVPETGECSFETRLQRIRDHWLLLRATAADPTSLPRRVNRSLAELVFLWAVVPVGEDTPADADQALEDARRVAERLESDGKPALLEVAADLEARVEVVRRIARALVLLLRTRGTVLARGFAGQRHTYYVNVLPDIVDWQRIAAELDEPLAASAQSSEEQIDFLRNISISRGESLRNALLSVRVDVHLVERSLRAVGDSAVLATRRVLPDTLAHVVWRPTAARGSSDPREEPWLV